MKRPFVLAALIMALLIAMFLPSMASAQSPPTPGYVIHVDLETRETKRAAIIPIRVFEDVRFIVDLGTLEVSGLIEIKTNVGLGAGLGKSGDLVKDGSLKWNAGLSWLDDFESAWKPRVGFYLGVTWKPPG